MYLVHKLMTGTSTSCQEGDEFVQLFTTSVDCGVPGDPKRGSLESYSDTTEGSEVFYSCDPGLVPEGTMRTVCTRNEWSPNPADLNCTEGML